jgi:ribose/xylose/arabinose/galactoside ABC-type transport system permease subunit
MVQASTVAMRGLSFTTTGGLANPVFSLLETLGAAGLSFFAILMPVIAVILAFALVLFVLSRTLRKKTRRE